MVAIDGVQYFTKEQAAAQCRAWVAAHPGTQFFNYAHSKRVSRPLTDAEAAAERQKAARGACYDTMKTVFEFNKLYYDGALVTAHPELRGFWRVRWEE